MGGGIKWTPSVAFGKGPGDLHSALDYYLYTLRNLRQMTQVPDVIEKVMGTYFLRSAEYAALSEDEQDYYFQVWKHETDRRHVYNSQKILGREEGREEVVTGMFPLGLSDEQISAASKVPIARVAELRKKWEASQQDQSGPPSTTPG